MPTLKGTEASLSCVQCFLYLVPFKINVSTFHSTWLDTSKTFYELSSCVIGQTFLRFSIKKNGEKFFQWDMCSVLFTATACFILAYYLFIYLMIIDVFARC